MIYVECKPDKALVQTLLPEVSPRGIVHEKKGTVIQLLSGSRGHRALIDEDPGTLPHPYLEQMTEQERFPGTGIRLLLDEERNHRVVLLCPRLEGWVVDAAQVARLNLADYNLPTDPDRLHGVINLNISKFQVLVQRLRDSDRFQARFEALRRWLVG